MLHDGYHDVPAGKVATVVTTLEMRAPVGLRSVSAPDGWDLVHVATPDHDWYRALFRAVGQDWLWFGRLTQSDATLDAILHDPLVHVFALRKGDVDGGLLELDFRVQGACELAYFGLTAPLIGIGAGRFLMNRAIEMAWAGDVTRFHVHTCTLDSPQALGFYRRAGFAPVSQQIEIADDPRLVHGYAHSLAPHVPIFEP